MTLVCKAFISSCLTHLLIFAALAALILSSKIFILEPAVEDYVSIETYH